MRPEGPKKLFFETAPVISESGWRPPPPPPPLPEGLDQPLPRGSSDRSEIMSNGQKAGRKRVKVREYLSTFPFFLNHTWDTPTTLRLTIDLATFCLILREFETGKRNFASGGSRPSDRGRGGGGLSSKPWGKRGGRAPLLDSPLFACEYSHLFSLLATGDAKRLSWWGARRDGFTRRLKGSWRVLFRYCLSVICGMISFTP